MSKLTVPTTTVILNNPSQWYAWIALVRSSAKQSDIWDYIDPALPQEPAHAAPVRPKRADAEGSNEIEKANNYTDSVLEYNTKYKEY